MPRHSGPVLVDTNVILECWRVGSWRVLGGGYATETVEDCVTETQTGFQRRRLEQRIDAVALRQSMARVHEVSPANLAAAIVRDEGISFLDVGERSLWAHALTRTDDWVLCGPDKASLRFGVRLGFRDRLVALERLVNDVGHRPREALAQEQCSTCRRERSSSAASSVGRCARARSNRSRNPAWPRCSNGC